MTILLDAAIIHNIPVLDECAFSNPVWAAALNRAAGQTQENTAFVAAIDPAGHTATPQMERDAVEWFVMHL